MVGGQDPRPDIDRGRREDVQHQRIRQGRCQLSSGTIPPPAALPAIKSIDNIELHVEKAMLKPYKVAKERRCDVGIDIEWVGVVSDVVNGQSDSKTMALEPVGQRNI